MCPIHSWADVQDLTWSINFNIKYTFHWGCSATAVVLHLPLKGPFVWHWYRWSALSHSGRFIIGLNVQSTVSVSRHWWSTNMKTKTVDYETLDGLYGYSKSLWKQENWVTGMLLLEWCYYFYGESTENSWYRQNRADKITYFTVNHNL